VGIARLLFLLGLYLVVEMRSGSQRLAGIAATLAICYPNFLFFSAQFSYESLALPLTGLVILAVLSSRDARPGKRSILGVALLIAGAIVVTHHLTSFLFAGFLFLCVVVVTVRPRLFDSLALRLSRFTCRALRLHSSTAADALAAAASDNENRPEGRALFAGIFLLVGLAAVSWMLTVGTLVIHYLGPLAANALLGTVHVIHAPGGARPLFHAANPRTVAPPWERLVAFGSVGLTLLGLLLGVLAVLTVLPGLLRRVPRQTVHAALVAVAMGYPAVLLLRLVPSGAEMSNRLLDFLAVPLGLVLATGVSALWLRQAGGAVRRLIFLVWFAVLFAGSVVIGTPQWARLPGPYIVGGDTRSVQPESLDAALWTHRYLGAGNRLIADNTNGLLMGSYGTQDPVYGLSWLYFTPTLDATALRALRIHDVQYVVVDGRLSRDLPVTGYYFEGGEPQAGEHTHPIPLTRLDKFNRVGSFDRIFDSGNIHIYRANALTPAPSPLRMRRFSHAGGRRSGAPPVRPLTASRSTGGNHA
jgi:hypothetical protein